MDRRWMLAAALLLVAGGALAWSWHAQPEGGGVAGDYQVRVVGGQGLVWEGLAHSEGDALSLLVDAASRGQFELAVEDRGRGYGPKECAGMYVVSVAGQREGGIGGWTYDVYDRDGVREHPLHSAACHPLQPGDAVVWRWSEGGV